ncbi:MAG: amidohydrolase family protein [Calothrix sp. SM1_5_4]|nr:amidohydrolase family protein [Calothrix sp. SM1_5_4]
MRIEACHDSHVHWAATGEFPQRLSLRGLSSANDILGLKPEPHHFRGEWLLGFGWDDGVWKDSPSLEILDQWVGERPVALTRCDGHALWLNTAALKRVGYFDGADGAAGAESPAGGRFFATARGGPPEWFWIRLVTRYARCSRR